VALSITQYQVPPGSAVPLGPGLPAGPYYALISAGSAASSGIYLTYAGATSPTTQGMYIPGGAPVPVQGFAGSGAEPLYAIASSGTVNAVLMVSTPR
jgi:hypothetical protein